MKFHVNRKLLPMKMHYFLWNAGTAPVLPYLSSFARQLGFSSVVVGFIYTVLPIVGILSKPILGMIADRFQCRKRMFFTMQLLVAVSILAISLTPRSADEVLEAPVNLMKHDDSLVFNFVETVLITHCEDISYVEELINCKLRCSVTNGEQSNSALVEFGIKPKYEGNEYKILEIGSKEVVMNYLHSLKTNSSTPCQLRCNQTSFHRQFLRYPLEDREVYRSFRYWYFLAMMIFFWIGSATCSSVGDAICFQLLGEDSHKYGFQRMYGALGWGLVSIFAGLLIDLPSLSKSEKDFSVVFYTSAGLIILDLLVSVRIQDTQVKSAKHASSSICRLLLNIKIDAFLIWCITVGICSGLIWNFLYWLIEDLANIHDCETRYYVKTLEGLVQTVQTLFGELPLFFLSGWILKKLGHWNAMCLISFGMGLRLILYSVIPNPWWFLPVELINGIDFGLFFTCMTSYAHVIAPEGTETTIQALVGSFYEGIGLAAGGALSGLAYKKFGSIKTFRYFGMFSIVIAILLITITIMTQCLEKFFDKHRNTKINQQRQTA